MSDLSQVKKGTTWKLPVEARALLRRVPPPRGLAVFQRRWPGWDFLFSKLQLLVFQGRS